MMLTKLAQFVLGLQVVNFFDLWNTQIAKLFKTHQDWISLWHYAIFLIIIVEKLAIIE